jgi:hypothetical protein
MIDWRAKNLVLSEMKEVLYMKIPEGRKLYPGQTTVNIIYGGTSSATDQARRFVVKVWSVTVTQTWMTSYGPNLLRDFLIELTCEMIAQRGVTRSAQYIAIDTEDFMGKDPEEKEQGQDEDTGAWICNGDWS